MRRSLARLVVLLLPLARPAAGDGGEADLAVANFRYHTGFSADERIPVPVIVYRFDVANEGAAPAPFLTFTFQHEAPPAPLTRVRNTQQGASHDVVAPGETRAYEVAVGFVPWPTGCVTVRTPSPESDLADNKACGTYGPPPALP